MSISASSEDHEQGPLGSLLLGSPPMPPRRHRGDKNQGGLTYLLLSSQVLALSLLSLPCLRNGDEDQQGLPYLRLGSPLAMETAPTHRLHREYEGQGGLRHLTLGSSLVTIAIPRLPPGAFPPATDASLPAVTSRMRSGDLKEGHTAYLAFDQACDDKTPWQSAPMVRFENLV
ncbi:hypothetical protein MRB53_009996 [Persea americana]|uniref:Uncharacterized protein n=1 Tax=Persea americana TaxID=3435 RepID=A0ACC2LRR2_PERAE|nr:hypothetical protein MRB53_009996 [Persea americana]